MFFVTGKMTIIETISRDGKDNFIKLEQLPKTVKLSFMKQEHHLVGIINFHPPAVQRRNSDINEIGHFVGIARRRNGAWVEYNDRKRSETRRSHEYLVLPHVLIYSI